MVWELLHTCNVYCECSEKLLYNVIINENIICKAAKIGNLLSLKNHDREWWSETSSFANGSYIVEFEVYYTLG